MSATDDATISTVHRSTRGLTLALAALAGAAVGMVVALLGAPTDRPLFVATTPWTGGEPAANEWPRAPRSGETARVVAAPGGTWLAVRAPRAPQARELAAGLLARRDAAVGALNESRERLERNWSEGLRPGPSVNTSPAVRCASLLLAGARQRRDLVEHAPAAWAAPRVDVPAPPAEVAEGLQDVTRAAEQRDGDALAGALVTEAAAEEDWFAAQATADAAAHAQRPARWRAWQLATADSFAALAQRTLAAARGPAADSAQVASVAALGWLAGRTPPPYEGLLRAVTPAAEPEAVPIAQAWARWLGIGALLGAVVSLFGALAGFALRAPHPGQAMAFVPARDPGGRDAWLHIVAGPNAGAVARAALELSAHALARGERVLVVDGGPHLRLHERFGREARWGLMECLVAEMPIIGLVQYGGRPGFYLLAHGNPARGEGWAALGQRLDDARPHFGRVVLALDGDAPRAIGDALAGRALEGWWAEGTARLPRTAIELTARLGIAFSGLGLGELSEVSLEALGDRVIALAGRVIAPAAPAIAPISAPVPLPASAAPLEPIVLDCDLQVRQRLRFLAWMRQVQSERRRVEAGSLT